MKRLLIIALLLTAMPLFGADAPKTAKTATIEASGKPVVDVLKEIAASTGETILVEKLVSGTVTASLKNVTAEEAISAATKSCKLQWRKIYVMQGSSLAKDPDALAAQMRTVLALTFPDIVISASGSGGSFMHVQKELAANELTKSIPAAAGMVAVYLVTDDEKAYKKELKDESKKKIAKYIADQKEQMKTFLAMSPEERKATLKEGMNLLNQIGPDGMQQMIESVMDADPQFLGEQNRVAMQAIMQMAPEARKSLLRRQMQMQQDMFKNMPPDQMQQFMKEAQEIAQEMQAGK